MINHSRELLVYTFAPGASFEGQLVGALERVESGGAMRILDALFVAREPESGELVAVSLSADGAAGMVGRLVSFRLDRRSRQQVTERAMSGPAAETVSSLAAGLEPGAAIAAILVEHTWKNALADAINRIGGSLQISDFVDATGIAEVSARLTEIAPGPGLTETGP